ncbi:hypothetical protein BJI69_17670 [Luteibacter rhizovicinus DSM 16549]|uniref:Uncharacterized protein n=1 Tax=Luteibacter rhizovicinus DSM 16549 TaxID=1440763 RepID=A0A0G9HHB5_9GAMM|nr:DinB family protein [Luteibacter rhizovicinus]APG05548.1 hypothetical protein BJI69_17670 [Luteibacter rhizovicinus DSM 16549]KLD67057.1 hypothetical protein Y883_10910 [Luteibacter rhizovicinus DSM 16549]KLD79654.1 hypothetical protein Y886_03370 [Xanthomonas hyacinthi DSM 19077]
MPSSVLRSLFAQKVFANDALLTKLDGWADAHPSEHLACLRLLNHALLVDQVFKAHLTGASPAVATVSAPEQPTLEALRSEVAAIDRWYEDYVASLPGASLDEVVAFTFTDGDRGSMTRDEILHHVVLHSTYHRGNVGQILRSLGMAPSRDTLTSFLHMREPERRAV